MARYESSEPTEIVDRLLWRDAQQMLDRHAEADRDGRCEWCGWHWPCPPRRLAERAETASRQAWRESWTARHDLNGLRTLPSWRLEKPEPPELLPEPPEPLPEPAEQPQELEYAPAGSSEPEHAPAGTAQLEYAPAHSAGAERAPDGAAGVASRVAHHARPSPPPGPAPLPPREFAPASDQAPTTPAGGRFD